MNSDPTLWQFLPFLLGGIPLTLFITATAITLTVVVAVVLGLARRSSRLAVSWPAGFVVEVFRGSSAVVQLFWAFYVLPFFGIDLPPLVAGILVLGLNEGSYFSEVVRSALNAVPPGQREAAVTLGLPAHYRFFRVILPQALPVMIPPFGNALVTMLKFSALTSLVTVQELAFRGNLIAETIGANAPVYSIVIVTYFLMALVLGHGVRLLEHRVERSSGRSAVQKKDMRRRSQVPAWALGRLK